MNKNEILSSILEAVQKGNYALRPHAVRHILEEGFSEKDIQEAIENGRILELYMNEDRCLIVGKFHLTKNVKEFLHIVVDFWSESGSIEWVDIITSYIPRLPFWKTPYQRGERE